MESFWPLLIIVMLFAAVGITWYASRLPSPIDGPQPIADRTEPPLTAPPIPPAAPIEVAPAAAAQVSPADRFMAILGEVTPAGTMVIIVGTVVATIGLAMGIGADPGNSSPRQAVAALWIIGGLIGLGIVAIGIATVAITRVLARGFAQR